MTLPSSRSEMCSCTTERLHWWKEHPIQSKPYHPVWLGESLGVRNAHRAQPCFPCLPPLLRRGGSTFSPSFLFLSFFFGEGRSHYASADFSECFISTTDSSTTTVPFMTSVRSKSVRSVRAKFLAETLRSKSTSSSSKVRSLLSGR